MDRNSSAGIATRYQLDSPGIHSRWGRDILRLSILALSPPSLLHNGYQAIPGSKVTGSGVNNPPHLALKLKKKYGSISSPPFGLRGLFQGQFLTFDLTVQKHSDKNQLLTNDKDSRNHYPPDDNTRIQENKTGHIER